MLLNAIISLSTVRIILGVVQFLTPFVIIRILPVDEFGLYQGFVAITAVLVIVASFGFDASVLYFLPNEKDKAKNVISNTSIAVLLISACVSLIFIGLNRLEIIGHYSLSDLVQCIAYLLAFANLNWIENYLLSNNKLKELALYATTRLAIRMLAIILAAYYFRDSNAIILALILTEFLRLILVFWWLKPRLCPCNAIDFPLAARQARYAFPVGMTGILSALSLHAGKVAIITLNGPTTLALYAIAAYVQVVASLIKTGIQEAIFPELVKSATNTQRMLDLNKKATTFQFAIFVFVCGFLFVRAEKLSNVVMPADFVGAIPVIQIFSFILVRRAFNFDSVFRASGISKLSLKGSAIALFVNLATTALLWNIYGWYAPAIGYVFSEIIMEIFFFYKAKTHFGVKTELLIDSPSLVKCLVVTLISVFGILVLEGYFSETVAGLFLELATYTIGGIVLARLAGIEVLNIALSRTLWIAKSVFRSGRKRI